MPYSPKLSDDRRSRLSSRSNSTRPSIVKISRKKKYVTPKKTDATPKKLARKRSGTKESGSPNPSFEFQLGSETDLKSNDPDALREEPSFEDSIDPGVDQDTDSSDQYDTDMEIVEVKPIFLPYTCTNAYKEQCRRLNICPLPDVLHTIETDVLKVRHQRLTDVDAKAISVALFDNWTVKTIDLEDNFIGSEGAKDIAEVLSNSVTIIELNLADNNIGGYGLLALVDVIATSETMRILKLSGNGFRDDHANYILKLLTENFRLSELDISYNHFGQCSAPILAQAILANDTLQYLNLSYNQLGKLHAYQFTSAFKERTDIRDLNISWNGLGDPGAIGIGMYLAVNVDIAILDISNNNITAKGAAYIAKGLKENTSLGTLRMGQNPIGPEGALSVITALSLNERHVMRTLNLKDVWVKHDFVEIGKAVCQRKHIDIVIGGILEDYQESSKEQTKKVKIKQNAAADIAERLKMLIENDPFIYLAYHMDNRNLPTEEFAKNLPIERRYRTVNIAAFKPLLEEVDMPEYLMAKLINLIKFRDEKIKVEKFRKIFVRAVKAKRDLISAIGEMPRLDEDDEEDDADYQEYKHLYHHASDQLRTGSCLTLSRPSSGQSSEEQH